MIDSIWTDELVTRLVTSFHAGRAYGCIARELGVTRNAVCGKISRLGFAARTPRINAASNEQRRLERAAKDNDRQRECRARHRASPLPTMIERPVIMPFMGSLDIPFAQLTDFKTSDSNQCRYIAAEPAGPDYLACGNPTKSGASYCNHHAGILFNRGLSLSDAERDRRASQATRNWSAAVVKAQNGPMEASA